jgi:ubiquinone/menaquinone biosynthesis C-methylase UbiE
MSVALLSDRQVAAFDFEQLDDARWSPLQQRIASEFPDGRFSLLDVGGGNGAFVDRVLRTYPDAVATVLDISEYMLDRNVPHARKTMLRKSVADLPQLRDRYDVVAAHWFLHHLVGRTYRETLANQREALRSMARLLTPRGRISVFENNYAGWISDSLPGYLIYQLTASKTLAPVTRRLGANSAGVGVCFQSREQWRQAFRDAGLDCLGYVEPDVWEWPLRWHWRVATTVSDIRAGHFWLRAGAARADEPALTVR